MDLKSKITLDIKSFTSGMRTVAAQTKDVGKQMTKAFSDASTTLGEIGDALKNDMGEFGAMDTLKGHMKGLGDALADSVVKGFNDAKVKAGSSINELKNSISGLITILNDDIKNTGLFNTLRTHVEYAFTSMRSNIMSFVQQTVPQLASSAIPVFTRLSTAIGAMSAQFIASRQSMSSMLSKAVTPMVTGLTKLQSTVNKFATNLSGKLNISNKQLQAASTNTKKLGKDLKNVGRIVQGILIAQLFYRSLNAIQSVVSATWEFAKALEYSKLVYTNFFGDVQLAEDFTAVLQDFAAQTRFGFGELNQAAQQLTAYGFEYKNLMFMLKGVTAAASVTGDINKVESISRALGQMNNKGRVMAEELRQLAEANIPAYDILQEKLGLSAKQMQNIGDQAIPASVAINALIEGITERFGGMLTATNMTLTGMVSNIGDLGLQMATILFEPLIARARWAAKGIMTVMQSTLGLIKEGGAGGLFEAIFPPELQGIIRSIIAALKSLWPSLQLIIYALINIGKAVGPSVLTFLNLFVNAATIAIGVVARLASFLSRLSGTATLLNVALSVAVAALGVFAIRAIWTFGSAAVIGGVKLFEKAILGVANSLVFLAKHPALFAIGALVALVLVATGTFNKAKDAVNSFFGSLNRKVSDTILQPKKMDKSTGSIDDFNKALDTTNEELEALTGAGKKAKKAADALSFDEVFKLSPDQTDSAKDIDSQWEELIKGIQAGNMDLTSIFEDVDFADFGGGFVDTLTTEFGKSLMGLGQKLLAGFDTVSFTNMLVSTVAAIMILATTGFTAAGIFGAIAAVLVGVFWDDLVAAFGVPAPDIGGSILGAIVGAIGLIVFGATPVGLFVGLASLFVGAFWKDLKEQFGLDWDFDWSTVLMGSITSSLALAMLGFTPKGIFVALAALVVSGFWDDIIESFGLEWDIGFGDVISTAIIGMAGKAIFGLKGGLWLALASALVLGFDKDLKEKFGEDMFANALASTVAVGIAGALAKTPKSGTLQTAIAGLGIAIAKKVAEELGEKLGKSEGEVDSAVEIGLIGGISLGVVAAIAGLPAGIVVALGTLAFTLAGLFKEEIKAVFESEAFKSAMALILAGAIGFAIAGVPGLIIGVIALAAATVAQHFWEDLEKYFKESFETYKQRIKDTWAPVLDLFNFEDKNLAEIGLNIVNGIISGIGATVLTIGETIWAVLVKPVIDVIKELFGINSPAETMKPVGQFLVEGIFGGISDTLEWLGTKIGEKVDTVVGYFQGWFDKTKEKATTWSTETGEKISTWATNAKDDIKSWYDETSVKVSTWATDAGKDIKDWATDAKKENKDARDKIKEHVSSWTSSTYTSISDWTEDSKGKLGTFISDSLTSIGTWASDVATKVSTALSDAWAGVKSLKADAETAISNVKTAVGNAWKTVTEFVTDNTPKTTNPTAPGIKIGHATGGVFNREHIAKFAEGNKTEAIIPLENKSAMQPFVDAVAGGITSSLAPLLANMGGSGGNSNNDLRPLYVGTLIADERGLAELNKQLKVIEISEMDRRGL